MNNFRYFLSTLSTGLETQEMGFYNPNNARNRLAKSFSAYASGEIKPHCILLIIQYKT